MKIKLKHKINISDADRLIERYYEGLTSLEEEKELQKFLSKPNLPERFETDKAILGYFDRKKPKKHFNVQPYVRWASVAAVIGFVIVSVQLITAENRNDFAYVDGVKITNAREVKSKALASLNDISSMNNEVEDGLNNLNDDNIIEQQLDMFSGLK